MSTEGNLKKYKKTNDVDFFDKGGSFFNIESATDILGIIGIVIPLITLGIVGYILYQTSASLLSNNELLENTITISPMLERLLLYLVDAETAQRGYIISGNINYLEFYNTSSKKVHEQTQNLLKLMSNNQSQQLVLKERVVPLVNKQLGILEQSISLNGRGFNNTGLLNNTALIDESKMNMDRIRTLIQILETDQNNFLKNRSQTLETDSNSMLNRVLFLIIIVFIVTAFTIFIVTSKIKRRNLDIKRKLEYEIKRNTKQIKESNIKLEKLNKQLKINDRLQKDFINIASHELRTPAQAITGYAEMALEDRDYKTIDSKHGQYITSINRNAARLQVLIEKILDVSKMENNSLHLYKENMDIIEEIDTVVKEFSIKLDISENKKNIKHNLSDYSNDINNKGTKVKINLIVPNHPIILKFDKIRIYQVMTNLLNNAIKASIDNSDGEIEPNITISVELRNYCDIDEKRSMLSGNEISTQFVFVSVTDSGKGISKEIVANIFSKFVSFTEKGIGLGLYISKHIINIHGGRIWAYNDHNKGKGATFTFTIPLNH